MLSSRREKRILEPFRMKEFGRGSVNDALLLDMV